MSMSPASCHNNPFVHHAKQIINKDNVRGDLQIVLQKPWLADRVMRKLCFMNQR